MGALIEMLKRESIKQARLRALYCSRTLSESQQLFFVSPGESVLWRIERRANPAQIETSHDI